MINIKGIAVATDGAMKRMAITYDEIDDTGKIINGNAKMNRVITDSTVNDHVSALYTYAESLITV